ncbi:MAG: hypothetical protein E6J91_33770 [Deltaproteobacteria bacterium]|nr:MAG: hypothetical protein E6J91_33770 [Deltaproteobacteria bacterium]
MQPSPEAARAAAGDAALGDLLAPLDADASQLAAVAAAAAGASFVLQGPPGTGKSQTIANLIAHCVAHGQTVLFVTEKMAALDVVHQRLAAIGLGEACLALHSHRAVRAQVVAQLGRVLERAFRPVAGSIAGDARLGELRAALDDHAAAMHRVGRFGRSLHEVLGRLVELRTTARAPLAERDAAGLDREAFERRRLAVEALAAAAGAVEPVASHPWRASTLERWPLDGCERTLAALDEAAAAAAELGAAMRDVEQLVPGVVGRTREQLIALGALGALAAASPCPGAELLTQLRAVQHDDLVERIALIRARGGGVLEPPRDPGEFLVVASRHRLLAYEVNDRFTDSVAELDAPALWAQLRRWIHRPAPLRFLALRKARAAIAAAAMPGMLETDGVVVTALEAVIAERATRAALIAAAEPARRWFGELGGDPLALDLKQIDAAVSWAGELRRAFDAVEVAGGPGRRIAAWRTLVAQVAASPAGAPVGGELAEFARLGAAVARWRPALAALAEATGIPEAALGAGDDHLAALAGEIEVLRGGIDVLSDWVAFHGARRAAHIAGAAPAVLAIERGDLAAGELAAAWERATLLAWADAEIAATPALARFHGPTHHTHAAAFADLDRAALTLVRARALVGIAERVPRVTSEPGGELGVLLHELKKQRGHRPLRRLFADIPTLLPRLAPCLLMSPLSVAQYLDPALPRFDLVVFDEASQLPTADAIGALARGSAAVVVGDSRQLPPTRFFEAGAPDDDDGDPAAEGEDVELESVLDDCVAARLPERHLTWHYRSRHEDLIAFSNRRYYGDRLQVFPAAQRSADLGVAWRRVDGVYDRGGTRQNRIEAEAVAAEVIGRLRDPVQRARSIGVVAFSRAQQALIEDLLEAARADDPELDGSFDRRMPSAGGGDPDGIAGGAGVLPRGSDGDGGEPVLIKNLETIQGDERDVVIVSVGYGPDASGRLTRNLGPLSQRGGERRLNVAITRAREQLIVVSSFAPEELCPPDSTADGAPVRAGQGVQDLVELLAFARDGGGAARPAADGSPGSCTTRSAAAPTSSISRSPTRTSPITTSWRSSTTARPTRAPARRAIAIACAPRCSASSAGASTGSGRSTGGRTPSARSSARTPRSSRPSRRAGSAGRRARAVRRSDPRRRAPPRARRRRRAHRAAARPHRSRSCAAWSRAPRPPPSARPRARSSHPRPPRARGRRTRWPRGSPTRRRASRAAAPRSASRATRSRSGPTWRRRSPPAGAPPTICTRRATSARSARSSSRCSPRRPRSTSTCSPAGSPRTSASAG